MRGLGALLFFLAFAVFARAEDWTTADGKTYKDVVVVAPEQDGVRITYLGGVGKIPYYELSDDLLRRFGQDPASLEHKREAAQKAAADAALKAQQDAAEQKKEQDDAAAAAALNPPPQMIAPPPKTAPPAPPHPVQPAAVNPNPVESASTEPSSPAFNPSAKPTEENPYPHSKFQYDEGRDLCDLDSYPVDLASISLDASPTAPSIQGQHATLVLRIETEGRRAQAPDTVTGIFVSNVPLKDLTANRQVKFLVDGAYIQGDPVPTDSDATPDATLQATQVIFTLTPEQVKSMVGGRNLNVSVGSYDYRIDDTGIAMLRGYQDDIDHLPPPSTNFVRSYHRLLNRLPSIVTMISTTCEYIILGAFALVFVAAIAAFIMGLMRFINM